MTTWSIRRRIDAAPRLLQLDARAGLLEVALELLALLPVNALLDRLRGLVHERLRLLESKPGGRAHDLDHLDLLVAGAGQHDVDGRRLFLHSRPVAARGSGGRSRSGDRLGGHTELFLERLDELGELEDGHLLDLFDQLCSGGHIALLYSVSPSEGVSVSSVSSPAASAPAGGGSSLQDSVSLPSAGLPP